MPRYQALPEVVSVVNQRVISSLCGAAVQRSLFSLYKSTFATVCQLARMPPRKRQASSSTKASEPSGRRRSTRASFGKKSGYFEDNDDLDELIDIKPPSPSKRARTSNAPKSRTRRKVTFIPHKQLRGLNGVDYADSHVHPNTMLFLRDLKANNRRVWLKENDAEYRRSLGDWQSFVESLTERLIAEVDDTIPELPSRDVIFRIYRDIRFSKDSTPYKAHYSAAWSRTGRKGPYACYYVHCEPAGCIVGGGLWHPDPPNVQLLRASIDERSHRWRRLLAGTGGRGADPDAFRRAFLPTAKHGNEAAAIKAFAKLNSSDALKTKPKGFTADHRNIELLKLRNFTAMKRIPDSFFTDVDGQDKIIDLMKALSGYVAHLNRIVRPDPNDADDTDSEGDEGDEDNGDEGENDEDEDEDS
ncbi:hypothetical protein CMQ_625 [Grosmannia clavigera kw1407]|uniref:Uncharacterized protein n=1 Tax=Grosmannia clavigera (strain kw1407 / UAMH 11150) TaxID=655863 RepID=F0XC68_GROCL|nr:uncharacterized protein CMQ_625 [Grosmannia clavigera kw1407]EFX03697.1 hypothetical protein CMQ_625 [Grosmannia clavigera kw1407]